MNSGTTELPWYVTSPAHDIPSPALLISPPRIEENLRRMIRIAGTADRLRPHVKTHKMAEVVRLKLRMGITRFKCSTLTECEMTAMCGAPDVMLAMQPTGPWLPAVFSLAARYPGTTFSVLCDHPKILQQLSDLAATLKTAIGVWIDINNGMNRTGIAPGEAAADLYRRMHLAPGLIVRGLHVYDGHIHTPDPAERAHQVQEDFRPVAAFIERLRAENLTIPALLAGGTPSFPIHATRGQAELSPGTLVLSDAGYAENFKDLDFLQAAVLLTRVVSLPSENMICLDLGHKFIAAEMPPPRLRIPELPEFTIVNHSEEHLVIRTERAKLFEPSDCLYAIPWHICPTVPRYPFAYTVADHQVTGTWNIDARDRIHHS